MSERVSSESPVSSMLFVCTGNICRSPMGERIAAGMAASAGLEVNVRSAGVRGMNGYGMHPFAAAVLEKHGYDASGFEARYLQPQILKDTDLVLCLTREHRAACQKLVPVRWKRMFTVVEFASLVSGSGGTLEDIIAGRGRLDPNAPALDIEDPMGQPIEDFERVFEETEPRVREIIDWLAAQGA